MYLQTDQGKEFENKQVRTFLKDEHGIKQFSVKSQFKASLVERLNRTIKTKMYRYFTHVGKRRWVEVLPKLIKAYNASVRRSIKTAPQDVNKRNEFSVWQAQDDLPAKAMLSKPLKVGDYVRLSNASQLFAKGYETQWTEEVSAVAQVIKGIGCPIMYKVKDCEGMDIEGVFYHEEVQRVT